MSFQKLLGRIIPALSEGETRTFKCKNCNDYTKQTQITYAVLAEEEPDIVDILTRILGDWNPVAALTAGSPHRCKRCGDIRFRGGTLSGTINKGIDKEAKKNNPFRK